MKNGLVFLFLLFLCATTVAGTSYVLLLDASGSMEEELDTGERKIDAAKSAAVEFLDSVSTSDEVALIVFYDCNDIRIVSEFTTDFESLKSAVQSVEPDSSTPIARAIRNATDYAVSNAHYSKKVIILLSDGEETCDSSSAPAKAAEYAKSRGVSVIHTIGYDVSPGSNAENQLRQVANVTGGKYYNASNAQDLKRSLKEVYEKESGGGLCCCPIPAIVLVLLLAALIIPK
ncbi:MAG: VWA domain-containing protein [Candidatus Micrarchaeia archaeon]